MTALHCVQGHPEGAITARADGTARCPVCALPLVPDLPSEKDDCVWPFILITSLLLLFVAGMWWWLRTFDL